MWIPKSEQDILSAIDAGDLVETATFDAKTSLPAKGKSKDLAIDVAAMAITRTQFPAIVGNTGNSKPFVYAMTTDIVS